MRVDAPRRKRKPPRKAPPVARQGETHQILDPAGKILRDSPYGEGATLALAQTLAQKYDDEVTLTVRLKALFGEPDDLYRIVREEDGAVSTYRV